MFFRHFPLLLLPLMPFSLSAQSPESPAWKAAQVGPTTVYQDSLLIPGLARKRNVWVMLPADYHKRTHRRYPVLYLCDGQNLLAEGGAPYGSWMLDSLLRSPGKEKWKQLIVVGMEHGGEHRIAEYTPFPHEKYGGGEAPQLLSFLLQELKPRIDASFRTRPQRAHTAIGGSSLGGLFSWYAFSTHPEVFGKAMVFSPSFWFAPQPQQTLQQAHAPQHPSRLYFYCGGDESRTMVPEMEQMVSLLQSQGYSGQEVHQQVERKGKHNERSWQQALPAALSWLFF